MKFEASEALVTRASIYAALAEPGRLVIADRLLLGDASPSDIGQLLSMPSNLVAHHLRVLEGAGLVRRVRSGGDRRRTYLSINPDVLETLTPHRIRKAKRVLFVCTGNAAQSQLAAAIWNHHNATTVPAASAGTHPAADVDPDALSAARRRNLALEPRTPRHVDTVVADGDLIIAVCDRAHEELPATMERLHWSVPDPNRTSMPGPYSRVIDELTRRISAFSPRLQPG
ncbi:ArsR family transcriptional regulator [Mycolicibacterium moriokaense]|nr:ArsR family transcriptional regulator [Mycolicibacterium moriokaense]